MIKTMYFSLYFYDILSGNYEKAKFVPETELNINSKTF